MRPGHRPAALACLAVVLGGCAGDTEEVATLEAELDEAREELTAERERADEAEERLEELKTRLAEEGQDGPGSEDPGSGDDDGAESLPDDPASYSTLHVEGLEPDVDPVAGDVTLALGPSTGSAVPFVAYNGTGGPISRLSVSGSFVDGGGERITSGRSQAVHPNVVEDDSVAFGFVYAGPNELPGDATLADPAVDYTDGLGDFENIVALDVEEFAATDGGFTGTVANPNDAADAGPIGVEVACLDNSGTAVDVLSTFADRDDIEPDGAATFTVDMFGDDPDECAGTMAGASGYVH